MISCAEFRRGDIHLADLGRPTGHEEAGKRPVLILQSGQFRDSNVLFVIPLSTSAIPKPRLAEVYLPSDVTGLKDNTVALCQHLRCLDRKKIQNRASGRLETNHTLFYEILYEVARLLELPLVPGS